MSQVVYSEFFGNSRKTWFRKCLIHDFESLASEIQPCTQEHLPKTLDATRNVLLKLKSVTCHPMHSATENMWEDCQFFFPFFTLFQNNKESCDGLVPAGNHTRTQPLSDTFSPTSSSRTGEEGEKREWETFWTKMKTGRSLTNYHCGQIRLDLV